MRYNRVPLENCFLAIQGRNFGCFGYQTINAVTSGGHFQKFVDFLSTYIYTYIEKTLYIREFLDLEN